MLLLKITLLSAHPQTERSIVPSDFLVPGISATFHELESSGAEDEFLEKLHDIAANAILDACTGSNPRQPSQEEMEKLLKCCYYDTEVDF